MGSCLSHFTWEISQAWELKTFPSVFKQGIAAFLLQNRVVTGTDAPAQAVSVSVRCVLGTALNYAKVWLQLGTKPVCSWNAFAQSWSTLKLRREGSSFENKVLMKLRIAKHKVMMRSDAMIAVLIIAVNM